MKKEVRPSLIDLLQKAAACTPVSKDTLRGESQNRGAKLKAEGDYPHWADPLQREYIDYQRDTTAQKRVCDNFSTWYKRRNNERTRTRGSSKAVSIARKR